MRGTAKALKTYFSSFGIPAYAQQSIPDDVPLPYITYPLKEPAWNEKTTMFAIVRYKATGYAALLEKVDQILADIGEGRQIELDNGYLFLYPEPTVVQEYSEPENGIKGIYINLSMNSYHMPGQ